MITGEAKWRRRQRTPRHIEAALLDIVAGAGDVQEKHLGPAVARAEKQFDAVMLAHLARISRRVARIERIARQALAGENCDEE